MGLMVDSRHVWSVRTDCVGFNSDFQDSNKVGNTLQKFAEDQRLELHVVTLIRAPDRVLSRPFSSTDCSFDPFIISSPYKSVGRSVT